MNFRSISPVDMEDLHPDDRLAMYRKRHVSIYFPDYKTHNINSCGRKSIPMTRRSQSWTSYGCSLLKKPMNWINNTQHPFYQLTCLQSFFSSLAPNYKFSHLHWFLGLFQRQKKLLLTVNKCCCVEHWYIVIALRFFKACRAWGIN